MRQTKASRFGRLSSHEANYVSKTSANETEEEMEVVVKETANHEDCEAFSVVNMNCLQGNYTGYDLSWVTSICTVMNTDKSPSFQKFEQFINNNNNTQLQV